jgi:hypothetical protein
MMPFARAAAGAVISILAIALPAQTHAENIVRRADAPGLSAYLPRFDEVEWLKQRAARPKPLTIMPEAGSPSALLFMPKPMPDWPQPLVQSAEAAPAYVGM